MKPTRIIIHHSLTKDGSTVSWDAIRWYHTRTNGWRDIGYHAGIELIGGHYEVLIGRMFDEEGAHATGHNSDSLGICLVGNFDTAPPPPAQLDLAIRFTRSLCRVLEIPATRVYRHSDFSAKTCPGALFPWGEFIRRLQ
jgi:hypothetical protein